MKLNPTFPERIFFIGMSIFLTYQSYKSFLAIHLFENTNWAAQLLLAAIVNLMVTGAFAFAVFGTSIEKILPNRYYQVKNAKRFNAWFKKLGSEGYRKFLLATVWRKKEMQKNLFDGTVNSFSTFEAKTKKSEFGHLLPFMIISFVCVYFVMEKLYWGAFFTMFINIIFNFYPVLLQRHHRIRLARLKKILELKNKR